MNGMICQMLLHRSGVVCKRGRVSRMVFNTTWLICQAGCSSNQHIFHQCHFAFSPSFSFLFSFTKCHVALSLSFSFLFLFCDVLICLVCAFYFIFSSFCSFIEVCVESVQHPRPDRQMSAAQRRVVKLTSAGSGAASSMIKYAARATCSSSRTQGLLKPRLHWNQILPNKIGPNMERIFGSIRWCRKVFVSGIRWLPESFEICRVVIRE